MFELVSDQWLFSPSGGIIGINSQAVWPVLNSLGLGVETYEDVRVIANGFIKALKEQRNNREE